MMLSVQKIPAADAIFKSEFFIFTSRTCMRALSNQKKLYCITANNFSSHSAKTFLVKYALA